MTYDEKIEYIDLIPKFTKKNDLSHTRRLLELLKHPERRFEIIHVAGSNGKGSVCAMINQVLIFAKKSTGLFCSPHLMDMRERFQVNGENCTREDFSEAFDDVMEAVQKMKEEGFAHPSYFEFLFAMGMCIFVKNRIEYAVLEVGLGGRLDATNIVEDPFLTIITSISLEHTEYLGNTIEKIAFEKAGIIKEGSCVIFDASNQQAAEVIKKKALEVRAPYYELLPEQLQILSWNGKKIDFSYQCRYDNNVKIQIPFVAEYQVMNSALAFQALDLLKAEAGIGRDMILSGLKNCHWPGRMQEIEQNIYFDGAHNPGGIEAFLKTVRHIGGDRPLLLFSIVNDKNYDKVIQSLAEVDWGTIILTQIPGARGTSGEILRQEFHKYGRSAVLKEEPGEAYAYAKQIRGEGQKLFCAGSLYLIGALEKLEVKND